MHSLCHQTADESSRNDEEAVFGVLSQVDEWMQNELPMYCYAASGGSDTSRQNACREHVNAGPRFVFAKLE
jgi:hypothetical protein